MEANVLLPAPGYAVGIWLRQMYLWEALELLCSLHLSCFSGISSASYVEFLLLSKDIFFMLSHFSLTAIDSHGTLHLALGLVGIHCCCFHIGGNQVFIFIIRYLLKSIKLVSYSYRILVSSISTGERGPVILWSFNNLCLISAGKSLQRLFCDQKMLLQKTSMLHSSKCYLSTSCL